MPKAATMDAAFWSHLNMMEGEPIKKSGAAAVSALNAYRNSPTPDNYNSALSALNDFQAQTKPAWERINREAVAAKKAK